MNKLFKKIAICALPSILLAHPLYAGAWTKHIDCEGGAVGSKVVDNLSNTLTFNGSKTIYSKEQVGTGSQSCKLTITGGTDGYPPPPDIAEWGGSDWFASPVTVGQEFWYRISVFIPKGFQVSTNSGMLKFVRIHTRTPTTNSGCLDFLFGVPGFSLWDVLTNKDVYPPHVLSWEGNSKSTFIGTRPANDIAYDRWETYEVYVNHDSVSKDAGGKGEVKIWKNNTLIADVTSQVSALDKSGVIDGVLLFTYWNGNSPATQSLYVDDIIETTDRPANRDASGNEFIGAPIMGATTAPSPLQSPPTPPSSIIIKSI